MFSNATASHRAFLANMDKNRYSDVVCIDESRVKLTIGSLQDGDYIHANYILPNIICTQGPTLNTIHDFWRMIYQEKIDYIVMLCRPVEEAKQKCVIYWPEKKGEVKTFRTVSVTNEGNEKDEFETTTFTVRIGSNIVSPVEMIKDTAPLTVKLLRYTEWPDRGVPDSKSCMVPLHILDKIRHCRSVVHCSAGIGRSGCLLALEIALRTLSANGVLAMIEVVYSLRCRRAHCIQTESQYVFLHGVLADFALSLPSLPPAARRNAFSFIQAMRSNDNEKAL